MQPSLVFRGLVTAVGHITPAEHAAGLLCVIVLTVAYKAESDK